MNLCEKIKLAIRYIKQWGIIPPRNASSKLSPDKLVSLVENSGFIIEDVQLIGNETKAIYLKCRKN